ncbi:formylglycine-generating enzyme family protein [Thiothrix lacustris]|uniref:formylglycine-generating enzyme family protein n=1 Tax=Thiothrix lacustris TaxID=525917 RepID=UPI0027E45D0B|nr:formylglycine-generating enzyme family protein [Thiothrix lacustris]WMP17924.1 formylglycine-generating enzyme family protein [Thiothrix lacustris]
MTYRNHLSPPTFPYAWASDWGEDRYGLWQAFTYQDVRHAFRWIQPGTFQMGSPETEKERWEDEDLHHVTVMYGFWLAETTVTQALWQTVMDDNPSLFKGDNRPVDSVDWEDTQTFIIKLNHIHTDLKVRLPWEAEWEYACRAGTQTSFNFSEELSLERVNYSGKWDDAGDDNRAKNATTDVKTYACNNWGLYEMHGNTSEWCADEWQEFLGKEDAVFNLFQCKVRPNAETGLGFTRVIRGGSWSSRGTNVRSAIRLGEDPRHTDSDIGFRLALVP